MRVTLLAQPHLGNNLRLGEQLRTLLSGDEGRFDRFEAAVAFVKQSGLSRLAAEIRAFRRGGGRAIASAGINHGGTSKQGLAALLDLFDECYVFYDRARARTFHPKIYLFRSASKGVVLLGSGNLTKGGLFTNYEAQIRLDFDLTDREDKARFKEFTDLLKYYQNPANPQVRALDRTLALQIESVLSDEFAQTEADVTAAETAEGDEAPIDRREHAALDGLFGTVRVTDAPPSDPSMRPPRRPGRTGRAPGRATPASAPEPVAVPPPAAAGPGFWKVLSNWDVNPGAAPGQIQIPIQFKPFFPPLRDSRDPAAPRRGNFKDTAPFSVRFKDGRFTATADDARYIVYPPAARPNEEGRFTFRHREIFTHLSAGDILIFQRSTDPRFFFEVERVQAADERYRQLRGRNKARWGLAGNP